MKVIEYCIGKSKDNTMIIVRDSKTKRELQKGIISIMFGNQYKRFHKANELGSLILEMAMHAHESSHYRLTSELRLLAQDLEVLASCGNLYSRLKWLRSTMNDMNLCIQCQKD